MNIEQRLAQLERAMWGRVCGPDGASSDGELEAAYDRIRQLETELARSQTREELAHEELERALRA